MVSKDESGRQEYKYRGRTETLDTAVLWAKPDTAASDSRERVPTLIQQGLLGAL